MQYLGKITEDKDIVRKEYTVGQKFLVDGVVKGEVFNDTRVPNQELEEGNIASGKYSHAEGMHTTASGEFSHSEGSNTIASGASSHAEGGYTIANSKAQHVQGEFNIADAEGTPTTRGKYAHIVGNGTSSSARSNAHTVDWNGNAWFAGDVFVGGASQDDVNTKKLVSAGEVYSKTEIDTALTNIDTAITEVLPVALPNGTTAGQVVDVIDGNIDQYYEAVFPTGIGTQIVGLPTYLSSYSGYNAKYMQLSDDTLLFVGYQESGTNIIGTINRDTAAITEIKSLGTSSNPNYCMIRRIAENLYFCGLGSTGYILKYDTATKNITITNGISLSSFAQLKPVITLLNDGVTLLIYQGAYLDDEETGDEYLWGSTIYRCIYNGSDTLSVAKSQYTPSGGLSQRPVISAMKELPEGQIYLRCYGLGFRYDERTENAIYNYNSDLMFLKVSKSTVEINDYVDLNGQYIYINENGTNKIIDTSTSALNAVYNVSSGISVSEKPANNNLLYHPDPYTFYFEDSYLTYLRKIRFSQDFTSIEEDVLVSTTLYPSTCTTYAVPRKALVSSGVVAWLITVGSSYGTPNKTHLLKADITPVPCKTAIALESKAYGENCKIAYSGIVLIDVPANTEISTEGVAAYAPKNNMLEVTGYWHYEPIIDSSVTGKIVISNGSYTSVNLGFKPKLVIIYEASNNSSALYSNSITGMAVPLVLTELYSYTDSRKITDTGFKFYGNASSFYYIAFR